MSRRFVVEADGGSRGNPGPAAYGALVRDADGTVLVELGERIGIASNNVAEYTGLVAGLTAARQLDVDGDATVEVRMDSKLVVEQMSGRWQVKHPDMKVLAKQALAAFPPERVRYTWIPRASNAHADRLVNAALDGRPIADVLPPTPQPDSPRESTAVAPGRLVGWSPDLGTPTSTVLVRHGETEHTRNRVFSGSGGADPALTDVGAEQARAAGRHLHGLGLDVAAVVSSPLKRTRQTAELVADALGLAGYQVDDDLRETAFGDWDGYGYAEVAARWPAELEAWLASTAVAPPYGESFDAVQHRVLAARDRLTADYQGKVVVVVTHVTPIKALVRDVLDAPPRALFRMELSPASVTTTHWWPDGGASLRSFNVVPPDAPATPR